MECLNRMLKKVFSWWNQNATKRWLLTLDRLCICWLISQCYESFIESGGISGVELEVGLLFLTAMILFVILYTPSHMFPQSDEEVGRKRKEP